jgi:hypothetical protein
MSYSQPELASVTASSNNETKLHSHLAMFNLPKAAIPNS